MAWIPFGEPGLDSDPRPGWSGPVTPLRVSAMRHTVVVLLMAVLTLAGVGRGVAAAADAEQDFISLPDVLAPICHSGGSVSPDPTSHRAPVHHDCCTDCALCAPVNLSAVPEIRTVTPAGHTVVSAAAVAVALCMSCARSPRQSQGPPAA